MLRNPRYAIALSVTTIATVVTAPMWVADPLSDAAGSVVVVSSQESPAPLTKPDRPIAFTWSCARLPIREHP